MFTNNCSIVYIILDFSELNKVAEGAMEIQSNLDCQKKVQNTTEIP